VARGLLTMAGVAQRDASFRILTITKDVFEDDVAALNRYGEEIAFDIIQIGVLKEIFNAFMPDGFDMPSNTYHLDGRYRDEKLAYRAFMREVIGHLAGQHGYAAVICCNFSYVAAQEISLACREIDIPYFVIYREGVVQPHRAVDEKLPYHKKKVFFGPIHARKIFMANAYAARWIDQMQRDYEHEFGVAGAPTRDIVPVGIPRLDLVRADRTVGTKRRGLTLFGYEPRVSFEYFREVTDPETGPAFLERANALAVRHYEAIVDFAVAHPEVTVTVKTKPTSKTAIYVGDMLQRAATRHGLDSLPTNVNLQTTDTPTALLRESRLAIAVNSTTVIESLLMGVRVLTPDFGGLFESGAPWSFLHDFPELSESFDSLEDIERAWCEAWTPDDAYRDARERCLEFFTLHKADELTSPRLTRLLAAELSRAPQARSAAAAE
jgi:hypothetical protein